MRAKKQLEFKKETLGMDEPLRYYHKSWADPVIGLCISKKWLSDECSRNDRQTVEVSDDCSKSVRLWRWGCIAAAACGLVWVTGTTRHPAPGTSGLSADPDSQRPKLSDIPTRSGEDKKGPKLLLRHRNQTWTNCGQSNLHQLGVMAHIGLEQFNSICSTFFGDVFDNIV